MKPPTPSDVKAARDSCGLTQTEAARLIYKSLRAWQSWEAEKGTINHREMCPALFELFNLKKGLRRA
jgi:DNA-binding transcriptional regulator YiaG